MSTVVQHGGSASVVQGGSASVSSSSSDVVTTITVGDANLTIANGTRVVVITAAYTAPRTITLPAAASLNDGEDLVIVDMVGAFTPTNTLTVQRGGSDTLNGGTSTLVFSTVRPNLRFTSDGTSKWVSRVAAVVEGGTGAATAAAALTNLGALSTTGTAADSSKLGGQLPSYYTDIITRLGYTPANLTGATFTGPVSATDLYVGGDFGNIAVHFSAPAAVQGAVKTGVFGAGVAGICGTAASQAGLVGRADRTDCYNAVWYFGTTFIGSVTNTGTTVAYNTSSDARLKDNIVPLVSEIDTGQVIDAMRPVAFDWHSGKHEHGFVAQELVKVVPDAVFVGDSDINNRPGNDGFVHWQIDKSVLIPYLVAELQDVRKRLSKLESK